MLAQCLWLILLSSIELCVGLAPGQLTDEQRPMELWTDPKFPGRWETSPTWHKATYWDLDFYGRPPSYLAALTLANAYFNWLENTPDNHARASGGNIVVMKHVLTLRCRLCAD